MIESQMAFLVCLPQQINVYCLCYEALHNFILLHVPTRSNVYVAIYFLEFYNFYLKFPLRELFG